MCALINQRAQAGYKIQIKKTLQPRLAYGVISVCQQILIVFHIIQHKIDDLVIIHHQVVLFDDFNGFRLNHPLEQRVNILKMIIKTIAVHAALGNQFTNGDLIDGLYSHQLFQRRGKLALG